MIRETASRAFLIPLLLLVEPRKEVVLGAEKASSTGGDGTAFSAWKPVVGADKCPDGDG